ncbi:TPA: hypothetical protein U2B00_001553 [Streptococcus suis]|nr:hypothetical protein [Streptococcus suis]
MTYTIDIFPKPENAPDRPYFTEEIFISSCQRELDNLKKVTKLLKAEHEIHTILKRSQELYRDMIYGVKTNQITFTNQGQEKRVIDD